MYQLFAGRLDYTRTLLASPLMTLFSEGLPVSMEVR